VRVAILAPPLLDPFQVAVIRTLLDEPRIEVVGACVDARKPPTPLEKLRRELARGRGGFVVVMSLSWMARRLTTPRTPAREFFREAGVETMDVLDLYAPETADFIRACRPGCIFRTGFGIIREPILSLAPRGVVSFHHGDIRLYRGQPVAFWELYDGASAVGVTVQVLNDKLDAGRIAVEISIPISASDTWRSLQREAFAQSRGMIAEACLRLSDPSFEPETVPEEDLGEVRTTPNLRQWCTLHLRVARRRLVAVATGVFRSASGEER
jgi:hypothetical protein